MLGPVVDVRDEGSSISKRLEKKTFHWPPPSHPLRACRTAWAGGRVSFGSLQTTLGSLPPVRVGTLKASSVTQPYRQRSREWGLAGNVLAKRTAPRRRSIWPSPPVVIGLVLGSGKLAHLAMICAGLVHKGAVQTGPHGGGRGGVC